MGAIVINDSQLFVLIYSHFLHEMHLSGICGNYNQIVQKIIWNVTLKML